MPHSFLDRTLYPTMKPGNHRYFLYIILLLLLAGSPSRAADNHAIFNGSWIINGKLSDDTDHQVEVSIRESGGKPDSGGKRGKGRYKGGPPEQALYDHLSYDEILEFNYNEPEFRLVYADGFERVFYSDNRKRVVSASGMAASDKQDASFATWDGDRLLVESRPRDGGWINETYELIPETGQLRVTLEAKPSSFGDPINIIRIYERPGASNSRSIDI